MNCKGKCRCNCNACKDDDHCSDDISDMCDSVFGPICEPEICDIPRAPRK